MGSALEVNPDIGLRELLQISQSNQWSVQYSPFSSSAGGRQGATIIRRASPIKGLTEEEVQEVQPGTYQGLQQAKSMAKETKDAEGFAIIKKGGEMKIVSQAAAELAEAGQGDWSVPDGAQGLPSFRDAIDELRSRGGSKPVLPSVA